MDRYIVFESDGADATPVGVIIVIITIVIVVIYDGFGEQHKQHCELFLVRACLAPSVIKAHNKE